MMKGRVLIVDDHDDARELLAELCSTLGQQVATASSGEQAIGLAMRFRPQLALVELGLMDLDGFSLAGVLRDRLGASCPRLVAVTAWPNARESALVAGFDDYILKPIRLHLLEQLIDRS